MLNNLKKTIEYVGLSYKKEQIKIIIANVICLALFAAVMIFYRSPMMIVVGLLLVVGVNYYIFSSYSSKKQRLNKQLRACSVSFYKTVFCIYKTKIHKKCVR